MADSLLIHCPTDASQTGAFRLSWEGAPGSTFILRENGQPLYEGPATATTVTGRLGGTYAYEVEAAGVRSPSCSVTVAPPSLGLAFTLFGVGLVVFACTLALIIHGHRQDARGEA